MSLKDDELRNFIDFFVDLAVVSSEYIQNGMD